MIWPQMSVHAVLLGAARRLNMTLLQLSWFYVSYTGDCLRSCAC